jgi:hypothetical protein
MKTSKVDAPSCQVLKRRRQRVILPILTTRRQLMTGRNEFERRNQNCPRPAAKGGANSLHRLQRARRPHLRGWEISRIAPGPRARFGVERYLTLASDGALPNEPTEMLVIAIHASINIVFLFDRHIASMLSCDVFLCVEWEKYGGFGRDQNNQRNAKLKKADIWPLIARDFAVSTDCNSIPEAQQLNKAISREVASYPKGDPRGPSMFLECEIVFGTKIKNKWSAVRSIFKKWYVKKSKSGEERHPCPDCISKIPNFLEFCEVRARCKLRSASRSRITLVCCRRGKS